MLRLMRELSIHSSQYRARSRWSGAEWRVDATELPERRVSLSRQIAAAIDVDVQKPVLPLFLDRLGWSGGGSFQIFPLFSLIWTWVRVFFLYSLPLYQLVSLSPHPLLSGDPSTSGGGEIGGCEGFHQWRRLVLPSLSVLSCFLILPPLSVLFFTLLFTVFSPSLSPFYFFLFSGLAMDDDDWFIGMFC